MNKPGSTPTTIAVDLKKYRIRIHKVSLHLLGDPKHIQLLVNPSSMEVAIRAVDKELSGAQTHRIDSYKMRSDNSYEIYSRSFVTKLCEVVGGLESNRTYRLTGEVLSAKRIALFSLKTIKPIEALENPDGK